MKNCKKNITLKKIMKYKFLGYKNVIRKWGHIAYDYCSHQFMTATLLSPAELLVDILYFFYKSMIWKTIRNPIIKNKPDINYILIITTPFENGVVSNNVDSSSS